MTYKLIKNKYPQGTLTLGCDEDHHPIRKLCHLMFKTYYKDLNKTCLNNLAKFSNQRHT